MSRHGRIAVWLSHVTYGWACCLLLHQGAQVSGLVYLEMGARLSVATEAVWTLFSTRTGTIAAMAVYAASVVIVASREARRATWPGSVLTHLALVHVASIPMVVCSFVMFWPILKRLP